MDVDLILDGIDTCGKLERVMHAPLVFSLQMAVKANILSLEQNMTSAGISTDDAHRIVEAVAAAQRAMLVMHP